MKEFKETQRIKKKKKTRIWNEIETEVKILKLSIYVTCILRTHVGM